MRQRKELDKSSQKIQCSKFHVEEQQTEEWKNEIRHLTTTQYEKSNFFSAEAFPALSRNVNRQKTDTIAVHLLT